MKITTDNLIENLPKIGAWSSYSLASEALQFYFPKEYDKEGDCILGTKREMDLCFKLECNSWQDVIIKYHKEIGYKRKQNIFQKIEVNKN